MRSAVLPLLLCVVVVAAGGGCVRRSPGAPDDDRCELGQEVEGGHAEPEASETVATPRKKAWEAARGGEVAARPVVAARLAGWPRVLAVAGDRLPDGDDAFLRRLARDTWRGLAAFTDREHALPVDHVTLGAPSLARDAARVGDYTNVTSVGLYLTAIVAAGELGLVSRAEAVRRARAVLATLDRLETHQGYFFNYYDTTSLERSSNFVSFVDSAWLTAGLVVVRGTFPELAPACTRLVDRIDWSFFYDPARGRMRHGYWAQRDAPSHYHYGVLYAESRLGSVLAIGSGRVPEAHWFAMARTFGPACRWQRRVPEGRRPKTVLGHPFVGGWYDWHGARYVPSWGGSMFEALMPTLVLDEPRLAPASLGANDVAHATLQRAYATDDLHLPVWGFSPSATLAPGGYGESGVPDLGTIGYAAGVVTPHASALALAVTPEPAAANLRALATRYPVYGDFGFYDAVDPQSGAVAHVYLTLDQEMIFLAVANRLCDGCVQRRFEADPIVQRALPLLAAERFFD
jgi:hypothetical protein